MGESEQSVELCIGTLLQGVLYNEARYLKLHGSKPDILALTAELRLDTLFILMDLSASHLACCKTKEPYACRYYIKNLYAGMQEAYKLLFGYGKCQRYVIWTKIGEAINSTPIRDWEEHSRLESLFQKVSMKLKGLTGVNIDKTHRNLTYHYDADMRQVYLYTLEANDFDEVSNMFITYMAVLTDMNILCDDIEGCLQKKGIEIADEIEPTSIDNGRHLSLIQYLSKNNELSVVLKEILNDVKPIDNYVFQLEKVNKLNELVSKQIELPEIDNIFVMLNLYLTVLFMRADVATITLSFIHSKTSGEAMLNMRRYVITITAAFSHLYGYSEGERSKSIWSSVMDMIPKDAECLREEAALINDLLQKVVVRQDMDIRTCYAHLYNNETRETNVPSIIDLMKKQDPVLELQKVMLMLKVTKRVMDFIKNVMKELSQRAHEDNEKSIAELRSTLQKVNDITEHPNCPTELKEGLSALIGKVKEWTKIEL